jgi:hypothetical protein
VRTLDGIDEADEADHAEHDSDDGANPEEGDHEGRDVHGGMFLCYPRVLTPVKKASHAVP